MVGARGGGRTVYGGVPTTIEERDVGAQLPRDLRHSAGRAPCRETRVVSVKCSVTV